MKKNQSIDELANEIKVNLKKIGYIESSKVVSKLEFHILFAQYQRDCHGLFLADRREDILGESFARNHLDPGSMKKILEEKQEPVILLYGMQGYGDFFMMARCLDYIAIRSKEVILCVYDPPPKFWVSSLTDLLNPDTMKKISVIPQNVEIVRETMKKNDITSLSQTCDMYSLYHALCKTPLDNGFGMEPYLRVNNPERRIFHRVMKENWEDEEEEDGGEPFEVDPTKFNVGIFFKTTSNYERKFGGKDVSENFFDPLLSLRDIQIFSLQRELTKEEKECVKNMNKDIVRVSEVCNDQCFRGVCHLLDRMDLIISIDSAMCHIAGGKGKKVFNLLPGLKRSICDRWKQKYVRKKKKKEKWWYCKMTKYFGIAGKFSGMGRYRVSSVDDDRASLLKQDVIKQYKRKMER